MRPRWICQLHRPQSSSAYRRTVLGRAAAAVGARSYASTQCPFEAISQAWANTFGPSASICSLRHRPDAARFKMPAWPCAFRTVRAACYRVELNQFEGVQEHAGVVAAIVDAVEARHAVVIAADRLAVDDAGARAQPGDQLEPPGVIVRAAVELDPGAVLSGDDPEAVVLDLVQLQRAGGQSRVIATLLFADAAEMNGDFDGSTNCRRISGRNKTEIGGERSHSERSEPYQFCRSRHSRSNADLCSWICLLP